MKRMLTGFCALALTAGLLTACTESGTDRVGDRPTGERTPSASPPTSTSPSTSTPPSGSGTSTSPSGSTSGSSSSPSGTGTK